MISKRTEISRQPVSYVHQNDLYCQALPLFCHQWLRTRRANTAIMKTVHMKMIRFAQREAFTRTWRLHGEGAMFSKRNNCHLLSRALFPIEMEAGIKGDEQAAPVTVDVISMQKKAQNFPVDDGISSTGKFCAHYLLWLIAWPMK